MEEMKGSTMNHISKSNPQVSLQYGSAMAGVFVLSAPVSAEIVGLNFSVGSVPYTGVVVTAAFSVDLSTTLANGAVGSFGQYNDPLGKTVYGGSSWTTFNPLVFLGPTTTGNPISALQTFSSGPVFTVSSTGDRLLGFRTSDNRYGWLRLDLGGPGGDLTFLDGAVNNTAGQGIVAGTLVAVPEPGSAALMGLAALAAGATVARRRRKKNRQESERSEEIGESIL